MDKQIKQYMLLIFTGALLGVAMQCLPHLQGQWGQNVIAFMADDLGCWAVLAVVISTYSSTALQSGGRCFAFMAAMVAAYYAMFPVSIAWNIRWIVLAVLMFPIGTLIYWYRSKTWVFILLEAGMLLFLAADIFTFVCKVRADQMIVYDRSGVSVLTGETWFSLGNYVLLILFILFGMVFLFRQYRKNR